MRANIKWAVNEMKKMRMKRIRLKRVNGTNCSPFTRPFYDFNWSDQRFVAHFFILFRNVIKYLANHVMLNKHCSFLKISHIIMFCPVVKQWTLYCIGLLCQSCWYFKCACYERQAHMKIQSKIFVFFRLRAKNWTKGKRKVWISKRK